VAERVRVRIQRSTLNAQRPTLNRFCHFIANGALEADMDVKIPTPERNWKWATQTFGIF